MGPIVYGSICHLNVLRGSQSNTDLYKSYYLARVAARVSLIFGMMILEIPFTLYSNGCRIVSPCVRTNTYAGYACWAHYFAPVFFVNVRFRDA
uniref:Uncharacterized protein n=1 Tax=Leersia perrieri TaxID=77586 RepID=A0A0D9WW22_9ORYZ